MLAKKYKKGNRVSKKYDPVLGKITKIRKHGDNFKVIFKNPEPKAGTTERFSVDDLAELREKAKRGKTEALNEKYKELMEPIRDKIATSHSRNRVFK